MNTGRAERWQQQVREQTLPETPSGPRRPAGDTQLVRWYFGHHFITGTLAHCILIRQVNLKHQAPLRSRARACYSLARLSVNNVVIFPEPTRVVHCSYQSISLQGGALPTVHTRPPIPVPAIIKSRLFGPLCYLLCFTFPTIDRESPTLRPRSTAPRRKGSGPRAPPQ